MGSMITEEDKMRIRIQHIILGVLVVALFAIWIMVTKQPDQVTLNTTTINNWRIGWSGTFTAYVNGEKVSNSSMVWESDNIQVATCVNGKLTAVGPGMANITCTKENGTVATCIVTVLENGIDIVTLNTESIENWKIGWTGTFTAYVNGEKVSNSSMVWNSSDVNVATCVDGKLTAVGIGTAEITCTKENGTEAVCIVNVTE